MVYGLLEVLVPARVRGSAVFVVVMRGVFFFRVERILGGVAVTVFWSEFGTYN